MSEQTDQLDELAQEVMRKVACGCIGVLHDEGHITENGLTHEILDPQLANLREVLWMEHPDCKPSEECLAFAFTMSEVRYAEEDTAPNCHGTGYVRRTWAGPEWWLATLLVKACFIDTGVEIEAWERGTPWLDLETTISATLAALKVKA